MSDYVNSPITYSLSTRGERQKLIVATLLRCFVALLIVLAMSYAKLFAICLLCT